MPNPTISSGILPSPTERRFPSASFLPLATPLPVEPPLPGHLPRPCSSFATWAGNHFSTSLWRQLSLPQPRPNLTQD